MIHKTNRGRFNSLDGLQRAPHTGQAQRLGSHFHLRASRKFPFDHVINCILGRALTIRGQSNVIPATTNSVLRCTVDGVAVGSDVVLANNLRSWKLCDGADLIDGHHDVVVNISAGADTVFWVDEITYETVDRPNQQRKYSRYPADTGEYRYKGVSWASPFENDFGYSRESYENGAAVTIPFYGTFSLLDYVSISSLVCRRINGSDGISHIANAQSRWPRILLARWRTRYGIRDTRVGARV